MQCPACPNSSLERQTDPGTHLEIDTCPDCQGLWFDAGELRQFFASPHLKEEFLPDARKERPQHSFEISSKARRCPRCRKGMARPTVGDVAVDVCQSCQGIWLDHGELYRLTQTYKNSGFKEDSVVADEIRAGLKGQGRKDSLLGEALGAVADFFTSFLGTPLR